MLIEYPEDNLYRLGQNTLDRVNELKKAENQPPGIH
jgi:hypothetical protein